LHNRRYCEYKILCDTHIKQTNKKQYVEFS